MNYRRFTALLVLALCAWAVQAQSGRKHTKPVAAEPVPTPTPEPTPLPKKPEKELLFYVGADRHESYATLPLSYHDAALHGCIDRLRAGSSANIDFTDRSFPRGDAIKKAKSETAVFVVYLSLTFDSMARSYDDLVLEFIVFEPQTAKVVANGRSYLTGARTGPIIVGPNTRGTSALFREELIKRAGEDAAARILKALHLDVGKTPNTHSP
jgi:hypothetical protein